MGVVRLFRIAGNVAIGWDRKSKEEYPLGLLERGDGYITLTIRIQ